MPETHNSKELDLLYEQEQNALNNEDYYSLISVYKSILRLEERNSDTYLYVKRKLVKAYIEYGAYLKMNTHGDKYLAKDSLERAVNLERNLPIAYYRLGHLYYHNNNFLESINNFKNALQYENPQFALNIQQKENANLFIAINSLRLFEEHKGNISENYTGYDSLYEEIRGFIESGLENYQQAEYYKIKRQRKIGISRKEKDEFLEKYEGLFLDFTTYELCVCYNYRQQPLTKNRMNLLEGLLIKSSARKPITVNNIQEFDCFDKSDVRSNTLNKTIGRLKLNLEALSPGLGGIIKSHGKGHYIDSSYPFYILKREEDI